MAGGAEGSAKEPIALSIGIVLHQVVGRGREADERPVRGEASWAGVRIRLGPRRTTG